MFEADLVEMGDGYFFFSDVTEHAEFCEELCVGEREENGVFKWAGLSVLEVGIFWFGIEEA